MPSGLPPEPARTASLRHEAAMMANVTLSSTYRNLVRDTDSSNNGTSSNESISSKTSPAMSSLTPSTSAQTTSARFENVVVAAITKAAKNAVGGLWPNYNPGSEYEDPKALRTTGPTGSGTAGLSSGATAQIIGSIHHEGVDFKVVDLKRRHNKDADKRRAGIEEVLSLYIQPIWSDAHQCNVANAQLLYDDTPDSYGTIPKLRQKAYASLRKRGSVRYQCPYCNHVSTPGGKISIDNHIKGRNSPNDKPKPHYRGCPTRIAFQDRQRAYGQVVPRVRLAIKVVYGTNEDLLRNGPGCL